MADHGPVCLLDVEPDAPAPAVPAHAADGRPYAGAAVAVRVHGELVGVVELPLDGEADGARLAARAADALRERIEAHLRADGPPAPDGAPPRCRREHARFLARAPAASVVVATRDGERTLGATLDALLALDYPRFEVLVVDNGSRGDGARSLVAERAEAAHPVRYVREPRHGLALAHNRGLAEADGAIVAFTDDDAVPDRAWLAQLAKAFEVAPDVACVTGLVLPAELESDAQIWVDAMWGFTKGFDRRVFDRRRPPGALLYPYTAGVFGSGANMAFRTAALRELGGFDPALGAGSPARGGDDLAAFFDVIAAGHRLVYEPTAVVRHRHRADYDSLRRQAYSYGVGLSAYLAKTLVDHPGRVLDVSARAPWALAYVLSPRSPKNARRPTALPAELARLERRGMVVGPFAYLRSRWWRRALYEPGGVR
ncbi:MAG: glycosyltransferase [Actinobacteria bacterium]|nr:MAG: glycosyltransferase [Actinomycetota bacterium]